MLTKTKTFAKTQVSFTADPMLKKQALEKAKQDGITLKALFVMAMKLYVNNKLILNLQPKDDYYDDVFSDKEVIAKANKLGELLKNKSL